MDRVEARSSGGWAGVPGAPSSPGPRGSGAPPADPVSADLRALSVPRLPGTAGAQRLNARLRRRFLDLGYEVRELPFLFSGVVGRIGVPLLGALFLLAGAAAVFFLAVGIPPLALLVLLAVGSIGLVAAYRYRELLVSLPWDRLEGRNWLVARPGTRPLYLVSAHRDSKSQGVPILVRAAGLMLLGAGWLLMVGVAGGATVFGVPAGGVIAVTATPLLLGAGIAVLCGVGNESPGALDNATGLAALLRIAEATRDLDGVGFLLTDAEELGLAGAWAVPADLPPVAGIINLDGLADEGPLHLIERFGLPPRGRASHLAAAILGAAAKQGLAARRRDLPAGVLVEHVAFTEAGIPSLTLMRGRRRDLARVHRPGDRADRLVGDGVRTVALVVEHALRILVEAGEHRAPALFRSRAAAGEEEVRPPPAPERTPLLDHRRRPRS